MKYDEHVISILNSLGVHKMYKGCEYILSGITFIYKNEKAYTPITKILYVEIAKLHKTSNICVEKDIRSVIDVIWEHKENEELVCRIFGRYYLNKRPTNTEFLAYLYDYLKYHTSNSICPILGVKCMLKN